MADLRLSAAAAAVAAVAAAALAGCGRAGAEPERSAERAPGPVSGLKPPAGWQSMITIAAAARVALGGGIEVESAEAWGEPAMGCYAVWLTFRTKGTAEAIGQQVVAGFAGDAAGSGSGAKLVVTDVAAPAGDEGVLALAFERGEHRGRLRARLGGGRVAAVACFANQREPLACEAACTTLLGALP